MCMYIFTPDRIDYARPMFNSSLLIFPAISMQLFDSGSSLKNMEFYKRGGVPLFHPTNMEVYKQIHRAACRSNYLRRYRVVKP